MQSPLAVRSAAIFLILAATFLFSATASAADFTEFTSDVYTGTHKVYAIDTEHFMIEYSPQVARSTDDDGDGIPNQIENVADYAETSWELEVEGTTLPDPLEDNTVQTKIYLILDDLATYLTPGAVGITSLFDDGSLYFAVDPNISDEVLSVTVAHEFFHIIQFSYQGYFVGYEQDINFAEMTATWSEELVYTDVNDYQWYIPEYLAETDFSIFTGVIPEGSLFEYGLSLWPIFLSEYFEDWTIVPQVLENYFTSDPDVWDSYEAYSAALTSLHSADIRDVYQLFALWNYVSSYYSDGALYPQVTVHGTHTADEYPLTEASMDDADWPALFGTNYVQFALDESQQGQDFQIIIEKSADIDLGLIFLPESADYYLVDELEMTRIDAGNGSATITMPIGEDTVQITLIVTPLASDPKVVEDPEVPFETGYQYLYSVEIGDFGTSGEVEVETTEATETTEETELGEEDSDKEGDEAGENSPDNITGETEVDALVVSELGISSQTDTAVSLHWTRVDDAAGYYLYYGTESGVYDYYDIVEGGSVTHYTVSDLWPETFYFVVTAYTEGLEESSSYSNEVSATLSVKDYSDVSESHDNYYAIRFLSYLGVVEGYEDGDFDPEGAINRAEMMKVMVYGYLGYSPDESTYKNCFPDVKDDWYAPYVCYAKEQGWVEGYSDSYFHPENTVSRAEALKMILKSFAIDVPTVANVSELPFDDVFSSTWYAPYVVTAYEKGMLEETGTAFDPNEGRTRAEVSEEIFRLLVLDFMLEETYNEEVLAGFLESWGEFFL